MLALRTEDRRWWLVAGPFLSKKDLNEAKA
jgi:hypothetical protein